MESATYLDFHGVENLHGSESHFSSLLLRLLHLIYGEKGVDLALLGAILGLIRTLAKKAWGLGK